MTTEQQQTYFQVRFGVDSWHRRLMTWYFGKSYFFNMESWAPTPHRISICKYWWSLVLAVVTSPFVFLIRSAIVPAFGHTGRFLAKNWPEWEPPSMSYDTKEKVKDGFAYSGLGLVVLLGAFLVYVIIASGNGWLALLVTGIGGGIIGLAILIALGVVIAKDRYDEYRYLHPRPVKLQKAREYEAPKPPKKNVFLEWVRAKKKKACPIIVWEEPQRA